MAAVREHAPGEVVARIAGRVVGEHKDDVRVGYAESFHGSIPAFFVVGTLSGDGHSGEAHIPNAFAICYPIIVRCRMHAVDERDLRDN